MFLVFSCPENETMIDPRIRKFENWHILLWLLKDLCWVADYKVAGTEMIVPTVIVAVWITWISRPNRSELIHNIAVVCWISANSVWMLGEFFWNDGTRLYAQWFFMLGLGILISFYLLELLRGKFNKPI